MAFRLIPLGAIAALFFCSPAGAAPSPSPSCAEKFPVSTRVEGPESPYTAQLLRLLQSWPPKDLPRESSSELEIRGYRTPGEDFYIGVGQFMKVDAPIEIVQAVMDDFASYQKLFPGYDDIHVSSRDGNHLRVFWEQHIPIFFVPNAKYEVNYLVSTCDPCRKIYRYQLYRSSSLTRDDGIIVLDSLARECGGSGGGTRYTEYDFYDANWGIAKTLAPGKIWEDSLEGLYLSDVAIRLRAEHWGDPKWDFKKIGEEGERIYKELGKPKLSTWISQKKEFNPF